jgi:molybdenum cofactor cytidylyltransferase
MGINISAIVLAAGISSRMGHPKLILPWGGTTVLWQVVSTFAAVGLEEIVVVTGGARKQIESLVAELARDFPVRPVFNPDFSRGGMLSSIKAGLKALDSSLSAALISLGDQPQVREETIRRICDAHSQSGSPLVVPSYQNRCGHPWLASASLWPTILALPESGTPRQFLDSHRGQIEYIAADESVLQDLDTPEDYTRQRP